MTRALREILLQVEKGTLSAEQALQQLRPSSDLGFAIVDHQRESRCGFPEVIFCPGKEPTQVLEIAQTILERSPRVLMTRAEEVQVTAVQAGLPEARHHRRARMLVVDREPLQRTGLVAVVAAGTADLPVAEEAAITAETMGTRVEAHHDVGVAGLHRLTARLGQIRRAHAIVVVAGMEGALPSVVAGLVDKPVVAVPTSVGYGASFAGVAPLLGMLNSCAAGVGVVNIDNGFGAGYLAALINRAAVSQST
ncbi:MAG: nickel pincer cofactor biosynthesis protein LarB [Planctomycetota bacterium]|jgi:NCAIR mutase (PurE)-related protein